MTRTSASFRRADRARVRHPAGFTLLEMLIVLALMAIASAVAVPRLAQTYRAVVESGERQDVARQLGRLPTLAVRSGEAIVVDAGDAAALGALLRLPATWSAEPLDALRVERNGFCHGARVRVAAAGSSAVLALARPDCTVSVAR